MSSARAPGRPMTSPSPTTTTTAITTMVRILTPAKPSKPPRQPLLLAKLPASRAAPRRAGSEHHPIADIQADRAGAGVTGRHVIQGAILEQQLADRGAWTEP